jgi:hypothetical protein
MPEGTVNVRYMVHDVDAAVEFYTKHFGFTVGTHAAPAFADVFRGNLRLLLSGPSSSAGRPMPDGAKPGPGGWNRVEFDRSNRARSASRVGMIGCTDGSISSRFAHSWSNSSIESGRRIASSPSSRILFTLIPRLRAPEVL